AIGCAAGVIHDAQIPQVGNWMQEAELPRQMSLDRRVALNQESGAPAGLLGSKAGDKPILNLDGVGMFNLVASAGAHGRPEREFISNQQPMGWRHHED